MNTTLEIWTDASMKYFPNGRCFGCYGTICIIDDVVYSKTQIDQDSTNNRSELLAIYLGCKMAYDMIKKFPNRFTDIRIYSDSQFGIFGLTKWMDGWLGRIDNNGVLYTTNNTPVKNQELFKMICAYLANNKLQIKFLHCSGHVNINREKDLLQANQIFYTSNGHWLSPVDIYKVSYYNNYVDKLTRKTIQKINPDDFPVVSHEDNYKIHFIIPINYKMFVQ